MTRFTAMICACSVAGLVTMISTGCQKADVADNSNTRIAVYDIDRVAHDMGWMTDMQTNLQSLQKQFQADLKHSQDQYNQQILDQKQKWAAKDTDKLTDDQKQVLAQMSNYAGQVLTQLNQNGNQQLNNYKTQWIIQYREALRPVLEQVAEERKLAVILEKNDTVQYNQPSSDITDAIIDTARAHPPVINPVPVPQLPNPGPMTIKWPDTQARHHQTCRWYLHAVSLTRAGRIRRRFSRFIDGSGQVDVPAVRGGRRAVLPD